MSLSLAYSRASSPVETFGGSTLAVGTWLYHQPPGGYSDAVVVVAIEGNTGPQAYSVLGGMRALPRTRITIRKDGGVGDTRVVEHIDDASLRRMVPGNYREHFGYLEAVKADPEIRVLFVARCQAEPARRTEEARRVEEAKEAARREIGPWFADLEDAMAHHDRAVGRGYVPDTVEAKVIRRALRELVGIKAGVGVRRYSMASGLNFGPPKGHEWTDAEAAAIASVFPSLAWPHRYYDRDTGEHRDGWRVDDSCHPSKREDRSDGMTDYYDPGGFRVANAHLLAVSAILSDEIEKATRS